MKTYKFDFDGSKADILSVGFNGEYEIEVWHGWHNPSGMFISTILPVAINRNKRGKFFSVQTKNGNHIIYPIISVVLKIMDANNFGFWSKQRNIGDIEP